MVKHQLNKSKRLQRGAAVMSLQDPGIRSVGVSASIQLLRVHVKRDCAASAFIWLYAYQMYELGVCVLSVRCTEKKKVFIWLRGFRRAVRRSLRLDLPRVRGEWEITRCVRREEVKNNLSSLYSLSHSPLSCCPSHLCSFFFFCLKLEYVRLTGSPLPFFPPGFLGRSFHAVIMLMWFSQESFARYRRLWVGLVIQLSSSD